MPHIYAINTHHVKKNRQEVAECWRKDGICAVGCGWTFKEEYGDEPPTGWSRPFWEISKGDIILAYASDNMIAYVGEVADNKLRDERKNRKNNTGCLYKYWNQRKVKWWRVPNHFRRKELPDWIHGQLGKRGQTIRRLELKGHTFKEAKKLIKTRPRSGSALASLNEDTVKAGLMNYFLSYAHVFERVLKIRRVEREVARGHRPDFGAQDAKGTPVIIECKGFATPESCRQLARYGRKHRKNHKSKRRPRLLLVAFAFEEACRKVASEAGIELFSCKLKLIREKGVSRN